MKNKPPVGPDTDKIDKIKRTASGICAACRVLNDYTIVTDERTNDTYVYKDGCYYCDTLLANILNKEIRNKLNGDYTITKKRNALGYIKDASLGPMKFTHGYISRRFGCI